MTSEPIPAWLALDVMADAIIDRRWGEHHPEDGPVEDWVKAKEADFDGTRDDMGDALAALAERFGLAVDWDAEPPEPQVIQAGGSMSTDGEER